VTAHRASQKTARIPIQSSSHLVWVIGRSLLIQGTNSNVRNIRRVTIAANAASGTNISASEETKAVWKWSAIPRTISDQAATRAKREARRMLKMECIGTNEDRSEWKMVIVSGRGVV
jgi:hypothetical protein